MQETTNMCARCAACDFASKRVWEANSDEVNELVADIFEEMKQHEIGNLREHQNDQFNVVLMLCHND